MFNPPGSVALYFQPLVNLNARRIIGFTAHSIRPGDDILRAACRAAAHWPDGIVLGVELAPARWHDPASGLRILAVLGETGLPAARLELEIDEGILSGGGRTMCRTLDELRAAGVMVALTGCGAQTEAVVPSFCFDTLKLAPPIAARLGRDADSVRIIDNLMTLATEHGLVTAADGIATEQQLAILDGKGCVEGQGPVFGKPVGLNSIPALLRFPSLAEAVA